MPKEIETKVNVDSPGRFRRKLKDLGAKFISREFQRDIYFKKPDKAGEVETIRLREVGGKGVFTVKKYVFGKNTSPYKVREEMEVTIDDVGMFRKVLAHMGMVARFRKEKIRERYHWKGTNIFLDRLPHIGYYAEIEGKKRDIKRTAAALGLDMKKATPETYMDIFRRYKAENKKPTIQLTFQSGNVRMARYS